MFLMKEFLPVVKSIKHQKYILDLFDLSFKAGQSYRYLFLFLESFKTRNSNSNKSYAKLGKECIMIFLTFQSIFKDWELNQLKQKCHPFNSSNPLLTLPLSLLKLYYLEKAKVKFLWYLVKVFTNLIAQNSTTEPV